MIQRWGKRAFDVIFSIGALLAWSPILIGIAILIKFTSPGPIIFKQLRIGRNMRPFYIYKFRTMISDAGQIQKSLMKTNEAIGPVFKMKNDPRVTQLGKFLRKTSLDEFPQFVNVLIGNMSIVGPRPPLPNEVNCYKTWQRKRLTVKPGITCLWQVTHKKNDMSFDEWAKLDLKYIDEHSFKLDLYITFLTIKAMLYGHNS